MTKAHNWLIYCCLLCIACHNKDQALEKELIASLDNNNRFIQSQTMSLYGELLNKDADPRTHEKIEPWQPKAKSIHKMSQEIYGYIDSIKARPEIQTRQSLNALLEEIERYRQKIPEALLRDSFPCSELRHDIEKDMKRFITELPIATTSHMSNVSAASSIAVWDKIKNDILLMEHYLIQYILKHIPDNYDGYDVFLPLIHQNSTRLKKGQQLVITAGIGAYSSATKKVTIDGHLYDLNAEGHARYILTPNGISGRHTIPVKIEYTLPDGASRNYTQNVEYEILP